jgi:ABC-2 type transport system permease protein
MTVVMRMTARLLRRGMAGLLALVLGVAIFELIQPIVADSFGGPEGIQAVFDALPSSLRALSRLEPNFIAISGLAGYLSVSFTHPIYLGLSASALIGFACRSLAGEMERGTVQLALSRPISRWRVYVARVLGLAAIALLLAVAGPLGLIGGMLVARPAGAFDYGHLVASVVASALLFWAIGGLTLFGSAIASTSGRAVGWAISGLVIFYFLDYFADLWEILKPFAPYSIFNYYDPGTALVDGRLPWVNIATLLLVGLAGITGGLIVFSRRDLPT